MAHNRHDARKRIAALLEADEYEPGKKTFARVYTAQMKKTGGESPIAMVWNGPLWFSQRRTEDASVNTAGIRIGIYVSRTKSEEAAEDYMDRSAAAVMRLVREHLQDDGYWYYLEFETQSYPDFPPVEEGTQYRREMIDLRAYFELGSL